MTHLINSRSIRIIIPIFFLALFIVGVNIYKDYGVSWDESAQRTTGQISLNYALHQDDALLRYQDRFYGPVFEMFLVSLEKMLGLGDDLREVYYLRHLCTFLLFFASVIVFYLLNSIIFRDWHYALFSALMLTFSPRIFAHAFINSKDLAFMAMFIIAMYSLIKVIEKQSLIGGVIHAICCGILIDIRIMGILVPAITLISLILINKNIKKVSVFVAVYSGVLIATVALLWPALWQNPLENFLAAFNHMSRFPEARTSFYLGHNFPSHELPWHYLFVWMGITTPVLYVALSMIGWVAVFNQKNVYSFIITAWFVVPLIAVMALHSSLYDGWRQMYFIYPALITLAVFGLRYLVESVHCRLPRQDWPLFKTIITTILILNFAVIGLKMVRLHPFEHMFFNRLAGKNMKAIKGRFELDYWGTSYRELLAFITANDQRELIKVHVPHLPGKLNRHMLDPKDRKRITYTDKLKDADYFVHNYRGLLGDFDSLKEVFAVKIDGENIAAVYRLN